jgi:type VI secretion system protein ImpF
MIKQDRTNAQASVLDRLVDTEPHLSREAVQRRLFDSEQIRASVVRDLENLLNTRRRITAPPPGFEELNRSLHVYGLPDFSSENPRSPVFQRRLLQAIEQTVSRFEPRLRNVSVRLDTSVQRERVFSFRISGVLVVEPLNEPVVFDSYYDARRGNYVVSG